MKRKRKPTDSNKRPVKTDLKQQLLHHDRERMAKPLSIPVPILPTTPFQVFITGGEKTLVVLADPNSPCLSLKHQIISKSSISLNPCNVRLFTKLGKPLPDGLRLADVGLSPNCSVDAKYSHCSKEQHQTCCESSWQLLALPQQDIWIQKSELLPTWIQNGPPCTNPANYQTPTIPSFCGSNTSVLIEKPLLHENQNEFFLSPLYADLFYTCGGNLVPAHSFIVLQHSTVLYHQFSKLNLNETCLKQILYFMYFGTLDPSLSLIELISLRENGTTCIMPKLVELCNTLIRVKIEVSGPPALVGLMASITIPTDVRKLCMTHFFLYVKKQNDPNQIHQLLSSVDGTLKSELLLNAVKGIDDIRLCGVKTKQRMALTPFEMFRDGEGSDLKIQVGYFTFNVHRIVLCANNTFFRMMLEGRFKETHQQTLTLPADAYPIVAFGEFLRLLYTGSVFFSSISMAVDLAILSDMLLQGDEREVLVQAKLFKQLSAFLIRNIAGLDDVVEFLGMDVALLPEVSMHSTQLLRKFHTQKKLTREVLETLPKQCAYDLLFPTNTKK